MSDIYKEYNWFEMKEWIEELHEYQEISKKQGVPIITCEQREKLLWTDGLNSEQREFTKKYAPSLLENDVISVAAHAAFLSDTPAIELGFGSVSADLIADWGMMVSGSGLIAGDESCPTEDSASAGVFSDGDDDDIIFNPVGNPCTNVPVGGQRAPNPAGAPSPIPVDKIQPHRGYGKTTRSSDPKDHQCEEGMTEIGGWMICKHCGDNLRKIR